MQTKFKFGCLVLLSLLAWLSPAKGQAPAVTVTDPPINTEVRSLTFVYVFFGENVTGVDASDLLINGVAATNVTVVSPAEYLFNFPSPPTGAVSVAWASANGIMDMADPPNAFAGGSWAYTLNPNSVTTSLIISEFLTDNVSGIKDEDGSRSDWIEIFNPGPIDANLDGWFLTDSSNPTNLTKWRFPSVFLGVNQYLLVWASANNRTNPATPLHTNFKLSKESGYLALVDPMTNVVSKFDPYPQQQTDVSYGRDRVDPNLLGYFTVPTPAAQNSTTGPGFTPEPIFSLDTGVYTNSSLTLSISAPLGTIRYTLNGTVPTNGSPLYTGPISFGTNMTIKARVFPPSGNLFPSPVIMRNFIFLDSTSASFTSKLPTLIISTEGRTIPQEVPPGASRGKGSFVCIDTFRGQSTIRGTPEVQELAEFEYFGQTSLGFPKRPIRIEIQDSLGNDLDKSLLGMPADSDWRLRNPYNDKTMLNDFLGFELWERMGHYSVRRKLVEVFLDTGGGRVAYPGDYYGVMVLTETIKASPKRLDIARVSTQSTNEPGYIVKRDKDSTGDLNFSTGGGAGGFGGIPLKLHEPKPNEMRNATSQGVTTTWPGSQYTPAGSNKMGYLTRFLSQMEAALYSTNWLTATGTNHYSYYLDSIACADQMLHVEFTKQIDGYRLSDYWNKDRNGKFGPGPVWDWNLAYGNADYLQGGITNTWYYEQAGQTDHLWPRRLITGTPSGTASSGDPNFVQLIADRWAMFRTNALNGPRTVDQIDELATLLSEAAARDLYGKYRVGLIGVYTWPNPDGTADANRRDVDFVHPTNYLGPIETKLGPASPTNSIIGQMKKWVMGRYLWMDSLFTQVPTFSIGSGMVVSGTNVTVVPPAGSILYYTLDGTDPRASGGSIASGALSNNGPVVITVTSNIQIVARAKAAGAWKGTYSGASDLSLYTSIPPLRITEIMYHPLPPTPGPGVTNIDEDFEYIEVMNVGATPLNVNRFTLSGGIDFTFPNRVLAAGERVVVVRNQDAFNSRYPGASAAVVGAYTGNLANEGNRIVLRGRTHEPILDFAYDDKWYPSTDGFGFSLVIVDANAALNTWGLASSWRPSGVLNGTPGQGDGAAPAIPRVVINEALTHSDPQPPSDTIELLNLSGSPASVAGWYLSDDLRNPFKFRIPLNTPPIPAGGFLTFDESQFNTPSNAPTSFALSSSGDEVYLFSADGAGQLTGYIHGFSFGPQLHGVTFGRYVISTGEEHFVAQSSATLGAANSGPKVGPIVISEIMYHPPDVFVHGSYWDNTEDEYIELQNISGSSAPLYDPLNPNNTWRLRDAVDFTFPLGVTLPPGGYALVVSFNPNDAAALAAFLSANGVQAGTPIYGPWQGKLDNSQDSVELVQPGVPDPVGSPTAGQFDYVLEDKVNYRDTAPWPAGLPDGLGASIGRINTAAYGNDPANWRTSPKTPGAPLPTGGVPPAITTQPSDTTGVEGQSATFSLAATGSALGYIWTFNGRAISGASAPTLTLNNLTYDQRGTYACFVFNSADSVQSSNAVLTVLRHPTIDQQPVDQRVNEGANATFSVFVRSDVPQTLHYQWRRGGVPIPNATSFALTLTNVISDVDDGIYSVVVNDSLGTLTSLDARLTVLLAPQFINPVPRLNLTAVPGENLTLGVQLRGTKPIFVQWRKFSPTGGSQGIIKTNAVNGNQDFLAILNVSTNAGATTNSAGIFAIQFTNIVGGTLTTTSTNHVAFLTVLLDSNNNGIPDSWESQYFGSPTGADRDADSDGDGMSNWAEYTAGTNPTNAASYLKVDSITVPGSALINFRVVAGKTYTVEYTDDLTNPVWARLADVTSRIVDSSVTVTDPAPQPDRYYRLVTPRRP